MGLSLALFSCVPKAQYEDQRHELQDAKSKLREAQIAQSECDPEAYLRLQEQSQSLDILTQELIDRNTELSREVTRLRAFEAKAGSADLLCAQRVAESAKKLEGQLERTRKTYEDLVSELKERIKHLEAELARTKASARPKNNTKKK